MAIDANPCSHVVHYIELNFDVVIIDLDSNPEYALEIVENLCAGSQSTVMVVSTSTDSELMIRCMRASQTAPTPG